MNVAEISECVIPVSGFDVTALGLSVEMLPAFGQALTSGNRAGPERRVEF